MKLSHCLRIGLLVLLGALWPIPANSTQVRTGRLGFGKKVRSVTFPHVANLAALRMYRTFQTNRIHRDGYAIPGDGGGADYLSQLSSCADAGFMSDGGGCVNAPDGSWVLDAETFAPDVRIWGAVDIGDGKVFGADSAAALNAAFAWCARWKAGHISIGQGRFAAFSESLTVPQGCEVKFVSHQSFRTDGLMPQYSIVRQSSAILIAPPFTIRLKGTMRDPAILRYGLGAPTSWQSAYHNVRGFAGTAVTYSAPDAKMFNATIIGFELCVSDRGYDRPWLVIGQIDCTNGISFQNVADLSHVIGLHGFAYYNNDLDGFSYANEEVPVTGVANNGSGLIRLTLASTADLETGQSIVIRHIGGFAGANGRWNIRVVDSKHIDLQGSAYSGLRRNGSWDAGKTMVNVESVSQMWYGQTVTGLNIPDGTTIRTIDPFNNKIWLSRPTTGAGREAYIAIANPAYTTGGVLINDNLYRSGTFIYVSGCCETHWTDIFEYGWRIGVHARDAVWPVVESYGCDTIGEPQNVCMWWDGSTTGAQWLGGEGGGVATLLLDTTVSAASSNSMRSVNARNNVEGEPPFAGMIFSGSGTREINAFSPNGGIISSILQYQSAGRTILSGNMPGWDVYPENAFADKSITIGDGTKFASGSPYVFSGQVSWTPILHFGSNSAGAQMSSYGVGEIRYPWMTATFNVALSAISANTGEAVISGLPAQCQGGRTSSAGGSTPFYQNMVSLTAPLEAMPDGSGDILLVMPGSTGTIPATNANFTASSILNGTIRCKIRFVQR